MGASTFDLRRARPDEHEALKALVWRASLANQVDRDALLAHPDAVEAPHRALATGHVVVAEQAGAVLGFAALIADRPRIHELDGLFVDPKVWRQGLGRRLLGWCVDAAKSDGAAAIEVVAHPEAEAFYRSAGFESVGPHQTRFGPALKMSLALPRPVMETSR